MTPEELFKRWERIAVAGGTPLVDRPGQAVNVTWLRGQGEYAIWRSALVMVMVWNVESWVCSTPDGCRGYDQHFNRYG